MPSFFKQVSLLLWKNLTQKRRQMKRNLMEIFWPCAIFIILVFVRQRKPATFPNDKKPFHFVPRALPSAGMLPFIQSIFCDYRVNISMDQHVDLPNYSNTFFSRFIKEASPIFTNKTKMDNLKGLLTSFSKINSDVSNVMKSADQLELNVSDLFGTADESRKVLTDSGLRTESVESLLRSKIRVPDAITYFSNNWNASSFDVSKIMNSNLIEMVELLLKEQTNLHEELCAKKGLETIIDFPSGIDVISTISDLCDEKTLTALIVVMLQRRESIVDNWKKNPKLEDVLKNLEDASYYVNVASNELSTLESFQNLLGDLNKQLNLQNESDPIDASQLICGTKTKKVEWESGEGKSKHVIVPLSPFSLGNEISLHTIDKVEKGKAMPTQGGGNNAKCNSINPPERVDCGWGSISEIQCVKLACCYDSSIKNAKYCFCPSYDTNNESLCCVKRRKLVEIISMGSGYTAEIANFMTRLLDGNVYYTPDNEKTREVIRRISSYLSSLSNSYDYFDSLRPILKDILNSPTILINEHLERADLFLVQLQNPLLSDLLKKQFPQYTSLLDQGLPQIQQFIRLYRSYANSSYIGDSNINYLKEILNFTLIHTREIEAALQCYNLSDFFKPIDSEEELVSFATSGKASSFLSSIVFLNLNDNTSWPTTMEYKLRFNPDYTPSSSKIKAKYWRPGPGPLGKNAFHYYSYINYGFVFLQDLIERTMMEILTNKTISEPGVYIQQMPYPCYIDDNFIAILGNFMPLFMTLAWVYTIAMVIKNIVHEKELRLKEVMKVMGLRNSAHWTAWFVTSQITVMVSIACLISLLKFGDIVSHSSTSLLVFVLFIFGSASIALAFLISVFFSKANVSAACGGIIYFFTHLLYPLTLWFEEQMSFSNVAGVSLFSTTAFGLAFKYISRWEEQGIGAQWNNLFENPMPNDNFNLGLSIMFMMMDTCIYLILTWYLEHVLPGEFGMPQPWYFPFTKIYWTGSKISSSKSQDKTKYKTSNSVDSLNEDVCGEENDAATDKFEKDPIGLKTGVYIKNLVKIYERGQKLAVDGLSLKMFEGQVTALLGHNGAGKSTTMSVLTGLFPPTSGTVLVYGKDICEDIKGVRESIGLCPQYNVLFDHLTVREHMCFFGCLKGLTGYVLDQEIEKFTSDVGLSKKRDELVCNLSGGMQRKLSVAMAFIANSKTVILDEPTSGVDPESRRSIWDLVLKSKKGRTILLSTHYMDEADLLGDRISIIANGKLQCSGTSLFLKRKFGKGYILTLTRDESCRVDLKLLDLTRFITTYVPHAEFHEDINTEISFVLPSTSTGEFAELFKSLERNMTQFGVKSYGISDTTLEEVFLKACNEDYLEYCKSSDNVSLTGSVQARRHSSSINNCVIDKIRKSSYASQTAMATTESEHEYSRKEKEEQLPELSKGLSLCLKQFFGLLIKRFHHARRSRKGYFSQILLPAVFVIMAMFVSYIRPPRTSETSLKLSTEMFEKPNHVIFESSHTDMFTRRLTESYLSHFGSDFNSVCTWSPCEDNNSSLFHQNLQEEECSCSTGKQKCPSLINEPPKLPTTNGDSITDLTRYNLTDYILRTEDTYKRSRYGGVSLGYRTAASPNANLDPMKNSNNGGLTTRRNAKVWYSLKGYHALPTYINLMNNAILHANLKANKDINDYRIPNNEYRIVAYNHPMDFDTEQIEDVAWKNSITDLFVAIFVITALAFVPASFLVYLVQDRISKSKHVQLVSGLHPVIYWLGNYCWDLANYMLPAFCVMIIFIGFNQHAYVAPQNAPCTFLLLLLYGWAMTPVMYPFSFYFDVPSTAYIVMIAANLFVGIIGTLSTFILEYFQESDAELKTINYYLKKCFLIFPNYCLGRGLMDLAKNHFRAELYDRFGTGEKGLDPLVWDVCGQNITFMFASGFLYMSFTLICQYGIRTIPQRFQMKSSGEKVNVEEDVANEVERIKTEEKDGKCFILKTNNLTKVYENNCRSKKTLAVDRLNIGVQQGECFGLLGVNGAGKTTTFKMLTGDSNITYGDAFVNGVSLCKNSNVAHKYMGYCPQFDALDELLTGRELLTFYSQIRGMANKDGARKTEELSRSLGLTQYMDRICGDYSGGNKRKLSTAISLLGSPPLVLMDEPTTGMDPVARRFLWDVVIEQLRVGKSIVFTSHSMEECETLCTRIAIMVNGELKCMGSPQHLRSKYGSGYTIVIRAESTEDIPSLIKTCFKDATLKDCHLYMFEFHVPCQNFLLSQIFVKLEDLKTSTIIDDYSVTQTTLDQIFVDFARQQIEAVQVDETKSENEYG